MPIYILGIYSLTQIESLPVKFLVSILMGITLSSLTFFLHDLMHKAILKSEKLTYLTGFSIGLFNLFAPLFWQRIHNFHHARTNKIDDPDRMYIWNERPSNFIEKIVYKLRPSKDAYSAELSLFNMSFGFLLYFFTMYYALLPNTFKNSSQYQSIEKLFKKKELFIVFSELALILTFQGFLFKVVAGGSFLNYFLIGILPMLITHFTTMLYIHTNHFLSPLTIETDDPLVNSLSIKNSKFVDLLYSNFSHHTEHHLFPSMSSSHYPKVRELLLKLYPERFQLMTMKQAVTLLNETPRVYREENYLVNYKGESRFDCLSPNQ